MKRRFPITGSPKRRLGEKGGSLEQNGTGNLSGAGYVNRSGRGLQFTGILRQAAIGALPAFRPVSVEDKYRYDYLWIGERPSGHNLVPNHTSAWDKRWAKSYGGFDDPNPGSRRNYIPVKFTPRQNPFYCALPYNDKAHTGHRPEAPQVVPWFKYAYQGPAVSTCKDRWIAICKGNPIAYAQWEDAGPFRTDHSQYRFGR